jgi:hypothetical protein
VQLTPNPNASASDAEQQARGRMTGVRGAQRRRLGQVCDGGGQERGAGSGVGEGQGSRSGGGQRNAKEKRGR